MVVSVAHEALAVLEELGAVHFSVGTVVGSESGILTNGVLHEGTTVVHLGVDDLAASPLVSSEGGLVNVEDLEPGAHDMVLLEFLIERLGGVTDDVLGADLGVVD